MKKITKEFLLVNFITMLRVIGAILLIPISINHGFFALAVVIILFVSTDWIDGLLARKLNTSTFFGAIFDSISDKVFSFVILSILALKYHPMIIALILELMILLTNSNAAAKGNNTHSTILGKVKTFFVATSVILSYILLDYFTALKYISFLPNLLQKDIDSCLLALSMVAIVSEAMTLINYLYINHENTKNNKIYQDKLKDVTGIIEYIKFRIKLVKNIKKNFKNKNELYEYLFSPEYYKKYKNEPIYNMGSKA